MYVGMLVHVHTVLAVSVRMYVHVQAFAMLCLQPHHAPWTAFPSVCRLQIFLCLLLGFCGCALALVLCWFGRLQAGGLSVGCLCGYPSAFLARWSMYVDRLAGVTAPNPQTNAVQD